MILKNARVICPKNGIDNVLDIKIKNGTISDIAENITESVAVIDLKGMVIAPAFIELHSHLRDPGLTEKETIETGTKAAMAGGYSHICCMANTIPVNDNPETLDYISGSRAYVKVLPVCAVTKGLEGKELTDMVNLKKLGAVAFSDDGKPVENMQKLKGAMRLAKDLNVLLMSHAEDSSIHSTDSVSEDIAVARELELVRKIGCKYHFSHISTKRSLDLIRQAKNDGLQVTCETAPHYFSLIKDDIVDGNPLYKVNPPLRTKEDLDAVIDALVDGTIDAIATDHAPHTQQEKQQAWTKAPMGINGFETAFGVCYTYLVKSGRLSLSQLVEKLSQNPAKILGLENTNEIKVGAKANLVVIDTVKQWTVTPETFHSKAKHSPFQGGILTGKIVKTMIKGEIYDCI